MRRGILIAAVVTAGAVLAGCGGPDWSQGTTEHAGDRITRILVQGMSTVPERPRLGPPSETLAACADPELADRPGMVRVHRRYGVTVQRPDGQPALLNNIRQTWLRNDLRVTADRLTPQGLPALPGTPLPVLEAVDGSGFRYLLLPGPGTGVTVEAESPCVRGSEAQE